jgi:glycolate oxidase FAD binding subunit
VPGVEAQARAAVELWREYGETQILREEEEPDSPTDAEEAKSDSVLLKISTVPTDLGQTLTDIMSAKDRRLGSRIHGYAGSGIVLVTLSGDRVQLVVACREIRSRVGKRGGTAVLQHAPPEIKREVDVWGPVGDALPLMESVKTRFDPKGIMNPGRFVGGL